jgi:phage FluMu protein Com
MKAWRASFLRLNVLGSSLESDPLHCYKRRGSVVMSQPIIFRCDHCKRELQVLVAFAGQTMKCPRCGGLLEVPGVTIVEGKKEEEGKPGGTES